MAKITGNSTKLFKKILEFQNLNNFYFVNSKKIIVVETKLIFLIHLNLMNFIRFKKEKKI